MSVPDQKAPAGEEAALLRRYAAGDPTAARQLVASLAPRVFGLARRLLDDPAEAEDVTQEAMTRLWRAAPQWREEGARVSTWLYRVTVNLCIDRRRRLKGPGRAERLDLLPEPADPRADVDATLMQSERARALAEALAELPERQRVAVVLRHIEGLANPDIAAILGVSVEAVESLTARGRRALAARLIGRRETLGHER